MTGRVSAKVPPLTTTPSKHSPVELIRTWFALLVPTCPPTAAASTELAATTPVASA